MLRFKPADKVLLVLFASFAFAFGYLHQREYRSYIPASRLDLLHALWTHGTCRIDAFHENTSNKATHRGHYYSDKAPGTAVIALPAFVVAAGVLKLTGTPLESNRGWLISSWIACAGSVGLIAALGGVALFAWLCQWVEPRHAYITAVTLFLGAAPLPYSTLLMSHGLVVGLLAVALWVGRWGLSSGTDRSRGGGARGDIIAGLCCGLAVASEYSAGIAVVAILTGFILSDAKRAWRLSVGLIPALMLIPAYHWICFGNPLTFAYLNEATFTQMHEGFFGIKFPPQAEHVWTLLFSTQTGLLFWSPVLLMAIVGYWRLFRVSRQIFAITYVAPLAQIAVISAYFFPSGGAMIGPRLLAPVLPLLALPVALGLAKLPRVGSLLAAVSIAVTTIATSVGILVIERHEIPFLGFHVRRLIDGTLSFNIGSELGLPGHLSLVLYALVLGCALSVVWRWLPRHRLEKDWAPGAIFDRPKVECTLA